MTKTDPIAPRAVFPLCAEGTARMIADPYHAASGQPARAGSLLVAMAQIEQLAALGFNLLSGFEHESYVLDPATLDPASRMVRQFGSFEEGRPGAAMKSRMPWRRSASPSQRSTSNMAEPARYRPAKVSAFVTLIFVQRATHGAQT